MDVDDAGWEGLVAGVTARLRQAAARRETVTYQRLVEELGAVGRATPRRPTAGDDRSLAALLRQVSTAEDEAGRGLLTAVVVRPSGLPAGGFFRLAEQRGRDVSDRRRAWEQELRRVHEANADGPGGPAGPAAPS